MAVAPISHTGIHKLRAISISPLATPSLDLVLVRLAPRLVLADSPGTRPITGRFCSRHARRGGQAPLGVCTCA